MNKKNKKRFMYGALALGLSCAFGATCVLASAQVVCTNAENAYIEPEYDSGYRYVGETLTKDNSAVFPYKQNSSPTYTKRDVWSYNTSGDWRKASESATMTNFGVNGAWKIYDFTSYDESDFIGWTFHLTANMYATGSVKVEDGTLTADKYEEAWGGFTMYIAVFDKEGQITSIPFHQSSYNAVGSFMYVDTQQMWGDELPTINILGGACEVWFFVKIDNWAGLSVSLNCTFNTTKMQSFTQSDQDEINAIVSDYNNGKLAVSNKFDELKELIQESYPAEPVNGAIGPISFISYDDSLTLVENVNNLGKNWDNFNNHWFTNIRARLVTIQSYAVSLGAQDFGMETRKNWAELDFGAIELATSLGGITASSATDQERINSLVKQLSDTQQQLTYFANAAEKANEEVSALMNKYSELESKYNAVVKERDNLKKQVNDLGDAKYSFTSLFWGIANTPFSFLNSMLNFELMGVNVFGLVTAIFTLVLSIIIIKRFI